MRSNRFTPVVGSAGGVIGGLFGVVVVYCVV